MALYFDIKPQVAFEKHPEGTPGPILLGQARARAKRVEGGTTPLAVFVEEQPVTRLRVSRKLLIAEPR